MQGLPGKIQANLELKYDKHKAKMLLKKYGLVYENRESDTNGMDLSEGPRKDSMPRAVYQIISPYIEELCKGDGSIF